MTFYSELERYGDRVAVTTEDGKNISYNELVAAGNVIADPIPARSLVFLVCQNCYESIAAYTGFLRRGVVPALINPKMDAELFAALMESYRPQYVFCPEGWYENGERVLDLGEHRLIKTGYTDNADINDELAVLVTTSGSTGSPKFVMQSYKNICSNAQSIADYLGITADDRAITTMPMSYTYGLSIIQSHLLMGARIIATEKTLMDKGFWALLKEQEATTFGGVPYIYEMLKRLRFGRMELPSLCYITQAGGKLSKELALEFSEICRDKGIKLIIMYGQTEATARMSYLPWEYAFSKAGSIGIAIPGGRFSLIDTQGNEITEPDVAGEMVYYGDNVTLGYAVGREDLINPDTRHGVLETGDIAKRDEDGFLYVVGRKKRFLKIFGNRVNLDETEGLLRSAGYDCACGGKDDEMTIYIVGANSETLGEAVSFISAKTGLNRAAYRAVSIPEIPRSDSGKIAYSKLEELYGQLR